MIAALRLLVKEILADESQRQKLVGRAQAAVLGQAKLPRGKHDCIQAKTQHLNTDEGTAMKARSPGDNPPRATCYLVEQTSSSQANQITNVNVSLTKEREGAKSKGNVQKHGKS